MDHFDTIGKTTLGKGKYLEGYCKGGGGGGGGIYYVKKESLYGLITEQELSIINQWKSLKYKIVLHISSSKKQIL